MESEFPHQGYTTLLNSIFAYSQMGTLGRHNSHKLSIKLRSSFCVESLAQDRAQLLKVIGLRQEMASFGQGITG